MKQSLRMRRVTWPLTGGKNSPHFWNFWSQFSYSLCHFRGATTKIKPCYRQKISFSHYEGYKVFCACAVSRNLCIVGPPRQHVTIYWTGIAYSLYTFYGATMTIKRSLYLSIPVLKRFSVVKSSRNRVSSGPPKWHFLTRNDVILRFLRKYWFRGISCNLIEEPPKNEEKNWYPQKHGKITYLGNRNPWTHRYEILHAGCRPGRNHACQFL